MTKHIQQKSKLTRLYIYIHVNSAIVLRLYHINIQNSVKCIYENIFILRIIKILVDFIFLT